MRKKKRLLFGIFGAVAAVAVMSPFLADARTKKSEDRVIPQGVYAGEIPLGGMTKEEASQVIEKEIAKLGEQKVTLAAGGHKVETTVGELGFSWGNPEIMEEAVNIGKSGNLIARYKALEDLEHEGKVYEISYAVDRNEVVRLLEENEDVLNEEAVDAKLEKTGESFSITPEIQGVAVDIETSAGQIEEFIRQEWDGSDITMELATDIVKPKGTQEELEKVQDLLGSFQTNYGNSNAGRRQNVENGTAKINGIVVYPGEEFSAYDVTSPYEQDNGYAIGGAYENGKVVDSVGGGICQVSTTLYNAVIRSELEITERFPHSMTVSYVKPSEDAAIAGTYKNLRFKNNTDAPVYIEGYTTGSIVGFNIYGQETRAANRRVDFESEILTTTNAGVEFHAAGDRPIGYISVDQSAHTGYTARLWKIVTVDGVEQEREIFNKSTYEASAKVVLVGTASANPDAVAAVNVAVATQDEATIYAAVAQWNDAAQAAAAQAAAEQAAAEQAAAEQAAAEQAAAEQAAAEQHQKDAGGQKKEKNEDKKRAEEQEE